MTKEELKQFNKELDEHEEKIKQPVSKLEGKLRRAENLNYQDAKLIKEYGDRIAELEKELKEWKDEWQEQVQKATDEGYARTLQTIQLSKAKEHIRTLISCLIDYIVPIDKDYCYIAEAEQFLKENG